jgi:endonuclease I
VGEARRDGVDFFFYHRYYSYYCSNYLSLNHKNNMKKNYTYILLMFASVLMAQSGNPAMPYYTGMTWTQTGTTLKTALANKLTTKHTNLISYSENWNAEIVTDADPANSSNVLLLYGWEAGIDADATNDLSRDKTLQCGAGSCNGLWNREHVYAKSLGTPALDDAAPSDAGEDAHMLRSCDFSRNNSRGNLKFAAGTGNSHAVSGGWYPGDAWKGDVARMMMYMYLRYDTQCLPTGVGIGSVNAIDANMIDLFLQWNADDPVNAYEDARNTYHDGVGTYKQGNRNPFIDNPYLATRIWGGPAAENRWPTVILATNQFDLFAGVSVYPNPANDHKININTNINIDEIDLININGQVMQVITKPSFNDNNFTIDNLPQGFYFLKLTSDNQSVTKKLIVN